MTKIGALVLGIYSLISVIILLIINLRRIAKKEDSGWELLILIPVLIFLSNVI